MRMKAVTNIDERRGPRRIGISLVARIVKGGSVEAVGAVTDISFYGIRMTCRRLTVEPGGYVSIALPRYGLVRAKVAWSNHGEFGATFLSPVDIRAFMMKSRAGRPVGPAAAAA
jgi:hypothetical protein